MKIFDVIENRFREKTDEDVRGIVYYEDAQNYEYGYFNKKYIKSYIPVKGYQPEPGIIKMVSVDSVLRGVTLKLPEGGSEILNHKYMKGYGEFPYSFNKEYEACNLLKKFNRSPKVKESKHFTLSDYMPYTFGLEFETSMGYITESKCFSNGLIPLRDGSIQGLEYASVVLNGDKGLNLLQQQLKILNDCTEFNKECSLHVHMGGLPVTAQHIYTLYRLCTLLQTDLVNYLPPLTLCTSKYKSTGKDYCKPLPSIKSFNDLYEWATGTPYMNSLTQGHPSDVNRKAKWNVHTRYYWLNIINMICYKSPKTVEFRFLRPTYNFRIIYMWLWVFNALLKTSETLVAHYPKETELRLVLEDKPITLRSIINNIYPSNIAKSLIDELRLFQIGTDLQIRNGDQCGEDVIIMEKLFKGKSPLL